MVLTRQKEGLTWATWCEEREKRREREENKVQIVVYSENLIQHFCHLLGTINNIFIGTFIMI